MSVKSTLHSQSYMYTVVEIRMIYISFLSYL